MKNRILLCIALYFQFYYCFSQQKELKKEKDGFTWYQIKQGEIYGAEDKDGIIIIPLSKGYTRVYYYRNESEPKGYFYVQNNINKVEFMGLYDVNGNEIISPDRGYTFVAVINNFINVDVKNNEGICDIYGKELISPSRGYSHIIYHDNFYGYECFVVYKGKNLKNQKEGLCMLDGTEVIAPEYDYINYDKNGFKVWKNKKKFESIGFVLPVKDPTRNIKIVKQKQKESDGFEWIRVIEGDVFGAEDVKGNVLIPTQRLYKELSYEIENITNHPYFLIGKAGGKGVCDLSGKEIIHPYYYSISYTKYGFVTKDGQGSKEYLQRLKLDSKGLAIKTSKEEENDFYDDQISKEIAKENKEKNAIAYLREKFNKAINLPESDYKSKEELYREILRGDPKDLLGLKAHAYNNIGVIYEYNINDLDKAQEYYEKALRIDPSNSKMEENLNNIKKKKRAEKWDKVSNVFDAVLSAVSNVSTAINGANGYADGSNMFSQNNVLFGSGFSGGGKDIMSLPTTPTANQDGEKIWRKDAGYGMIYVCKEKNGIRNETLYGPCKMCRGTKICSTCQGSRLCNFCQGKGGIVTSGYGQYLPCTACNRTGSCSLCQGTGRCSCTNYEYPGYNPGSTTLYDINGNIISTTSFTSGSSSSASSESRSSHSSTKSPCSRCHGTGVDPSPSSGGNLSAWVAHYNAAGETCPYCNRVTEHWHTRCSTCNVPQ